MAPAHRKKCGGKNTRAPALTVAPRSTERRTEEPNGTSSLQPRAAQDRKAGRGASQPDRHRLRSGGRGAARRQRLTPARTRRKDSAAQKEGERPRESRPRATSGGRGPSKAGPDQGASQPAAKRVLRTVVSGQRRRGRFLPPHRRRSRSALAHARRPLLGRSQGPPSLPAPGVIIFGRSGRRRWAVVRASRGDLRPEGGKPGRGPSPSCESESPPPRAPSPSRAESCGDGVLVRSATGCLGRLLALGWLVGARALVSSCGTRAVCGSAHRQGIR